MHNPTVLKIEVRYDGQNIAHDISFDREIDADTREFLARFIENQILPDVRRMTFKKVRTPQIKP